MSSAEPEHAPLLVDVLQQLELPAVEGLMDFVNRHCCVGALRLTCRAVRDLADAGVRISKKLSVQLRADGTVTEPLASLGRWGRRGGIRLWIQLPAEAPNGGVDAILPPAFTQLPQEARRLVAQVLVVRSTYAVPCPAVSVSAVAALAASLPCLRGLGLSGLPSTWTPGGAGEAYAALAGLGTLEELALPGVPGLTGVVALAGSLRCLRLVELRIPHHSLTLPAVAPLGQLTRLEELELHVRDVDLGEGPKLRSLLSLLPHSLGTLRIDFRNWGGELGHVFEGNFGVSGGRLVSVKLGFQGPLALAAVARDELLPCLGPGGRLESLSIHSLYVYGWGSTDVATILELWRRSDKARLGELSVDKRCTAADICSALTAFGTVDALSFRSPAVGLSWPPQPRPIAPTPLPDLPPPEEVLRMALQRIAPPGAGGEGGAAGGRPGTAAEEDAGSPMLLLRGPVAAAALEWPRCRAAVKAWAQDLESQARAAKGEALQHDAPLIRYAQPLPPASAVLLECSDAEGAAEAVAAAVAAAGDGSAAALVRAPLDGRLGRSALGWSLSEAMSELWAASCAGEGGPSLQQRVEWAMGLLNLIQDQPIAL